MKKFPVDSLLFGLLFAASSPLMAADDEAKTDELPSAELLEFLGGWDTPEGEQFDPLLLADDLLSQADTTVQDND